MRMFGAPIVAGLLAGAAQAQIIPLGAPIVPPPKTQAAPLPSQDNTGRLRAARPLGSNYSPYSLQPQAAVTASAPSAMPSERPVVSGVISDPTFADPDAKKPGKTQPNQTSDMQRLAPKAAERSDMPAADADVPPKR